ncbi:uncharacterized protein PAC_13972 [Phialocephala subalpina]|uniref:Uncharacterized protein n=1 Tax=Phialocephala subalpina TaxID=576137 RepID=A0A1L7XGA7_9HELO|nr:uncharacterized protein PAC_13972 [Phialocephala subalpina]
MKYSYEVTFLTRSEYESAVTSIGATFIPLGGSADTIETWIKNLLKEAAGGSLTTFDFITRKIFIDSNPGQWEGVKRALKSAVGSGQLPPEKTPEAQAQARNMELLKEEREVMYKEAQARFEEILEKSRILKELYARHPNMFFRNGIVLNADLFVQMCCPGIEYPRSNAPKTLRFAGGLPPGLRDPMETFPTENSARVEWAVSGVNLRTNRPTEEMLQKAVSEALENPKYKRRAEEIRAKMRNYEPFGTLVEASEELAGRE